MGTYFRFILKGTHIDLGEEKPTLKDAAKWLWENSPFFSGCRNWEEILPYLRGDEHERWYDAEDDVANMSAEIGGAWHLTRVFPAGFVSKEQFAEVTEWEWGSRISKDRKTDIPYYPDGRFSRIGA